MDNWKITRERSHCQKSGCPFPMAQQWMAVLDLPQCVRRDVCDTCFMQEQQHAKVADDPRDLIYWRVNRKAKDKKEPTLDLGTLAMLFERLGEVVGDGPVVFEPEADDVPHAEGGAPPEVEAPSSGSGEPSSGGGEPSSGSGEPDSLDGEAGPMDLARAASLRYFVALLLLRKRRLRAVPARTEAQAAADLVVKDPKKPDQPPILLYAPELDESDLNGLRDQLLGLVDPDYEPRDVPKAG